MAEINQLATALVSCAYCGQPFKQKDNHRFAWRSTSGKLYCSEFCASDEEQAASHSLRDFIQATTGA